MKRILRKPEAGLSGYLAVGTFAVIYLAAMVLVLAPETVKVAFDRPAALLQP